MLVVRSAEARGARATQQPSTEPCGRRPSTGHSSHGPGIAESRCRSVCSRGPASYGNNVDLATWSGAGARIARFSPAEIDRNSRDGAATDGFGAVCRDPPAPRPRSGPVAVAGAGAVAPRRTERRGNRRGDAGGCFGGSAAGGRRDRRTPLFKRGRSRSPQRLPTSRATCTAAYPRRYRLPHSFMYTTVVLVERTYNIDDSHAPL